MIDECEIGTETQALNETTGKYDVVPGPVVYSGKCLFVGANTAPLEVEAAGQQLVLVSAQLKLPVSTSAAVHPGMIARIRLKHDPGVGEVRVRVKAPNRQTYAIERKFPVEEV